LAALEDAVVESFRADSFHACLDSYRPSHFFGKSAMAEFAVSSWYLAGLLFLTPSFFALWHTGLAEPVGAFLIICAVIFSYRLVETWGEDAHRGCWIEALYALELVCVLLLGTLVKRENAALTVVLPLVFLFQRRDAHPRRRLDLRTMMKLVATSVVAALAQLFLLTTDVFALDAVRPSAVPLFSIANFRGPGPALSFPLR